jgi:uncharacterized protein
MLQKIILDIKGMHCRSCEIILEKNISKIEGVKRVKTNSKKGIAEIEYTDGHCDLQSIEKAVSASGYSLGKGDTKHFFSRNPKDYLELAAAASILFILYAIVSTFGIFDFKLNVNGNSGLLGVLVVGLTAGISTCMALIGGLVLGISSRHAELHPEASVAQKFRPHVFFNLGRLVSYVVLGGLIGFLGSAFKLSSSILGIITVALGFFLFFLGLKLVDIFPRLHNSTITLPKRVSKFLGLHRETTEYSHRGAFITGALTFFLPCGFTQAMQLYAISTGSFTQGALIMGIFALGTLPGIIGIGGLTSSIKGAFARYFFKCAGLVVVFLALFNIVSGLSLIGFSFPTAFRTDNLENISVEKGIRNENGKQIVEMTQLGNGYSPRQFTIKKGVPVVWKIRGTNQYSCAAYIVMPSYKISQPIELGENIIEFTPQQTGQARFTCSMGMYSGYFNVVD